ncbi:hypothetical protein KIL84_001852 [Mauremys mutica]|uniref:Uncharacterized protein n=1 Tax=Mauremys mutica TaxID=74926 RepID=A0A9D3XJ78_9SAUR|nr:hypothetical protein KIL84_001852 [Mauremys mutica]
MLPRGAVPRLVPQTHGEAEPATDPGERREPAIGTGTMVAPAPRIQAEMDPAVVPQIRTLQKRGWPCHVGGGCP